MVFSPARLYLTWQYFQVVLLISIALLSYEKVRPCLWWAQGQKKGTRFYTALISGLDLQGTVVLLLAALNLLLFFPLYFFLLLFFLNIHWSRGWKPVICSWWTCCLPSCGIACVVSDSVNICMQSRKSSRGRLEWSHSTPQSEGQGSGHGFSPGQPWEELESDF